MAVTGIDKDDLGPYTCEVTNKLGKSDINVTLMYEPEMAIFESSELLEDGFTELSWTVNSVQALQEVDLYYKHSGDKQWRQVKPFSIDQSSQTGVYK